MLLDLLQEVYAGQYAELSYHVSGNVVQTQPCLVLSHHNSLCVRGFSSSLTDLRIVMKVDLFLDEIANTHMSRILDVPLRALLLSNCVL